MLISVIAVGKVKDKDFLNKVKDYVKRISFDAKFNMIEVKDSEPVGEAKRLLEAIDKEKGYTVVLSEEGKEFTSNEFARKMGQIHQKMVFVIGGPDGLDESVKKRADLLMSLSKMTFVHEMARMLVLEQIYRGISINKGRKYHRN